MKKGGYRWWKERIDYALELFDIVRIDHFRGFDRFYAIPAGSGNAKRGEWLDGPKAALFEGLESSPIAVSYTHLYHLQKVMKPHCTLV